MATKKPSKGNPTKSKQEWTIPELQMWLGGAFALQGDAWVPNAEQWGMIVDIIYKLKERTLVKRGESQTTPINQPPPVLHQPYQNTNFTPDVQGQPPSSVLLGGMEQPNPSFNPVEEFPHIAVVDAGVVQSGNKTVKTPNIDTKTGYKSSFD